MINPELTEDRLLTPAEVGKLLSVNPKTVTRWTKAGKLPAVITPGGHHRYYESVIRAMLDTGYAF